MLQLAPAEARNSFADGQEQCMRVSRTGNRLRGQLRVVVPEPQGAAQRADLRPGELRDAAELAVRGRRQRACDLVLAGHFLAQRRQLVRRVGSLVARVVPSSWLTAS